MNEPVAHDLLEGKVINSRTRQGLPGARVEIWYDGGESPSFVGRAVCACDGQFSLALPKSEFQSDLLADVNTGECSQGLVFRFYRLKPGTDKHQVRFELDVPVPTATATVLPTKPGLQIVGTLTNRFNDEPLPGLTVLAYAVEPPDWEKNHHPVTKSTLLGTALSRSDGSFEIAFVSNKEVRAQICLLKEGCGHFTLEVRSPSNMVLTLSPLFPANCPTPLSIPIDLPARTIDSTSWQELGTALQKLNPPRLPDLVQLLSSADSKLADSGRWDLITRQSALGDIERAFLDPDGTLEKIAPVPGFKILRDPDGFRQFSAAITPHLGEPAVNSAFGRLTGKVERFANLRAIDWRIDSQLLSQSAVGNALSAFEGLYTGRNPEGFPQLAGDLARYRDYLVGVWVTTIRRFNGQITVAQAKLLLANRFHQDFTTGDELPRIANDNLIPILTEILTSPTGTQWGFGVPAASVPSQGTQTSRQYLDALIALTHVPLTQVELRYRLDLHRPDSDLVSAVQLNVDTLLGFFRDSFQCGPEPVHTAPDPANEPIIPGPMQRGALFFLEYDEWLQAQAPFYGENFYQLRQVYSFAALQSNERDQVRSLAKTAALADQATWAWYAGNLDLEESLLKAHAAFDQRRFGEARDRYYGCIGAALQLLSDKVVASLDFVSDFQTRRQRSVKNLLDLEALLQTFQATSFGGSAFLPGSPDYWNAWNEWRDDNLNRVHDALVHLVVYALPTYVADTALAGGDFPTAVFQHGRCANFLVAKAHSSDAPGYRPPYPDYFDDFPLYHAGDLPYTVELRLRDGQYIMPSPRDDDSSGWVGGTWEPADESDAYLLIPAHTHRVEIAFFKLRLANAMLEWADALYRSDEPAPIARARELYKGVLYLHGLDPGLCPTWPSRFPKGPHFGNEHENPAKLSQVTRAQRGFYQIEAGLNYFGYAEDMVPSLRYSPLKDAADRFVASAKEAQQDFLAYMGNLEALSIEAIKNAAMLRKAGLQAKIAAETAKVAQDDVNQAQLQLNQVNASITAKEGEIADHDSLFTQFSDYLSGMINTVKGLPNDTQSSVGSGLASTAGIDEMKGAGLLGLGEAGSVMGGIGIFGVASYMTLSSMNDAASKRQGDLQTLQNNTLPSAQAHLDAMKREVTIAGYQMQIAQADADLATDLITFQTQRFLNVEFWSTLAAVLQRVLRRFLELAARMAWLAERALAYEQDRTLGIIRLDYYPQALQGVTGADLLQLDLAELEAARLDGLKETAPVKHTYSLARDFPLQFAKLIGTGRCRFATQEDPFRQAYPGTYGYRIRAVTVTLNRSGVTSPPRGLLTNRGVSTLSRLDEAGQIELHPSVRPADALPISEFRLATDQTVYSLPDEALLPFEGSGVETEWNLEFPAAANPYGLGSLADVLLTFDVRAHYSPELYMTDLANVPHSTQRLIAVSAARHAPQGLADLTGSAATATFEFDSRRIGLAASESNRKAVNLFFLIVDSQLPSAQVSVASGAAPQVNVAFQNGVLASNNPPLSDAQSTVPHSPLNALAAGLSLDQVISLTIKKASNPGIDFSTVKDVVLGIEYQADLAS
jgi:hypothetical protein